MRIQSQKILNNRKISIHNFVEIFKTLFLQKNMEHFSTISKFELFKFQIYAYISIVKYPHCHSILRQINRHP